MKFLNVKAWVQNAPHLAVSLVIHVFVALILLNLVMETGSKPQIATVMSELSDVEEQEDFQEELVEEDINFDEPVSLTPQSGGGGIASSAETMEAPTQNTTEMAAAATLTDRSLNRPLAIGSGGMGLDSNVSGLKGMSEGAGGGGGDGGAVQRITLEILRQLASNKVVVAWVFDNSPSLTERRNAIADRMDRIYKELDELGANRDTALLTAVVSAGKDTKFLLEKPTDDLSTISKAIRAITEDESGQENVFTAIRETALKYRSLQTSGRRTLMIVLVTDEVGSDVGQADDTLALVERNNARLYIMGPMATFGINTILDHQVIDGFHFWEPIHRGPIGRRDETLRVAFNSTAYKSGFGPFALVQMARESGGVYFIFDDNRVKGPEYDVEVLNRYRPNYDPPADYLKEITSSNLRRRLMDVVEQGNKVWRGHAWPHQWIYAEDLANSLDGRSKDCATFLAFADKAIPILEAVEKEWDTETNPRWQANFDLNYARLLKAKVQAEEYRWALADMKLNPLTLKDPAKNNGWRIDWTKELHQGEKPGFKGDARNNSGNKQVQEANRLLEKSLFHYQRILDKHPETPWAEAAKRERSSSLGVVFKEGYDSTHAKKEDAKKRAEAAKKVKKQ